MKNVFLLSGIIICFYSCNSTAGEQQNLATSIRPYAAVQKMTATEFNHYHNVLENFFKSSLLKNFNGGIVVSKNDTIVYEKYQGLADLRKQDPVTQNTSFHIASVSKPMTAMAVLQLVQEQKLSLNDSLQKFFPGFPYSGVTVQMLLTHRSGLPNYLYFITEKNWDKNVYVTNKDVLQQLYSLQPKLSFSPGTHFSYSNTNFALLALIVEKVTNKAFPAYMKERFFDPLQMNDTYIFTLADSLKATHSFYTNGRLFENDFFEGTYGDKNVYTTPRDLLKWEKAITSGKIINQSLLDSAFTPYSFESKSIHNYGLGWRLASFPDGKKIIYHFGRWHGFNAALTYLPAENVTIIILGNKFTYNIYNTAHKCVDLFGDYWERNKEIEEEPDSLDNADAAVQSKAFHI